MIYSSMHIPDNNQTLELIAKQAELGNKLVFTNGCFDILHIGHVRYLSQAAQLGDALVVGLNSDTSVKTLKGSQRPINTQDIRKEMLLSIRAVDYVVIFDEDTPLSLIQTIKPHVLVKGGDWPTEKIVGADFVLSNGGKVYSLPFVDGYSTTNLLKQITTPSNCA